MKTEYTIYRPDAEPEKGSVDWRPDPSFRTIAALVEPLLDGAHMEHVNVWQDGQYLDMFVDELGSIKGLPLNTKATEVYHENWKVHRPERYAAAAAVGGITPIVGTAVLFHRKVWF